LQLLFRCKNIRAPEVKVFLETADMLIAAGIDVKNIASYKGNVLSILISGNYALEIDDLKEIVSFFLKKGIDINSSDK
jgi:hypothetical protein